MLHRICLERVNQKIHHVATFCSDTGFMKQKVTEEDVDLDLNCSDVIHFDRLLYRRQTEAVFSNQIGLSFILQTPRTLI